MITTSWKVEGHVSLGKESMMVETNADQQNTQSAQGSTTLDGQDSSDENERARCDSLLLRHAPAWRITQATQVSGDAPFRTATKRNNPIKG
jgi:hypothetical protein